MAQKQVIEESLQEPHSFLKRAASKLAHWRIEPRAGLLEHQVLGPCFGLLLVFAPALLTIFGANKCADFLHPIVASVFRTTDRLGRSRSPELFTVASDIAARWLRLWASQYGTVLVCVRFTHCDSVLDYPGGLEIFGVDRSDQPRYRSRCSPYWPVRSRYRSRHDGVRL